ncbi:MAG: phosphoribosylglycinamide formyltransferase [Alphaproteobacteria bacterium]|nr:phosphoribosylglycinamide formyltransferase [Alphaproteobacteria bacterium]OIN85163.1 MAG: phosphoribosylglycinamide formyltransferase [Alphaproteobacteria bacterium CG1_02_46_17]
MSQPLSSNKDKIGLAVLISGRGSNLQSLIDASKSPDYPAEIRLVLCNIPNVYGIERARQAGIPVSVIPHKDFATREDFERAMLNAMKDYDIDLVCQAGFMRILTPVFISAWGRRLINIHPSLLPKFKGLHTHERAIEAGETEAGCTIHYVTEGVDEGEVILQHRVPVLPDDTPESLAERVLGQEHLAYPEAVRLLAIDILENKKYSAH